AEPDRLAPLTPPAPIGLRGVWVVAARYCASPPARCCADALERSFACPSANLRAPSRRGLSPRSARRRPAAVSPRGKRIRSRRGCWHCCVDRAAPPVNAVSIFLTCAEVKFPRGAGYGDQPAV